MRKITRTVVGAFNQRRAARMGNTRTDGQHLWLHDNMIAEWRTDGLYVCNGGWSSSTTKDRLNGVAGVRVRQRNRRWQLNDVEWNGSWQRVANSANLRQIQDTMASAVIDDVLAADARIPLGSACTICGVNHRAATPAAELASTEDQ